AAMMEAGLRAVQSTPLLSRSGQMLGVLSTYCRTPCQPSDRDLRLLDILARLTADLIERKRAEAALLASESQFRQLADAMPQLVWTARPDGAIDYYNERWYEFTGFNRDAFAAIHFGQPYDIEYRFWDRRERRWRWFVGRALAVRDAQGNIVKWFGSCTD